METLNLQQENATGKFPVLSGKFLSFKIDEEEYGLEIMKVQEIIGVLPITKVPRLPQHVRGVFNLRGKIIPAIDVRMKFGLAHKKDTSRSCIIVVEVNSDKETMSMGLIVDEVAEVQDILEKEIESNCNFGAGISSGFLLGIGVIRGKVILILDIENLLTHEEVGSLADISSDTNDMIEDSQEKSDAGVAVAQEVVQVRNDVNTSVKKVNGLLTEVSAVNSEQARNLEQVNAAVSHTNQVTRSNTANAQETAYANLSREEHPGI